MRANDLTNSRQKVQSAIEKIVASFGEEGRKFIGNYKVLKGRDFYYRLFTQLGIEYGSSDKRQMAREASKALNEFGVEGIRYDGYTDGECAVVFNDQAIQILNTYYQQQNSINGSTTFLQSGERIIRLFETADQSTFSARIRA